MSRIIWFGPATPYSQSMRFLRENYLRAKQITPAMVFDASVHFRVKDCTKFTKYGAGSKESFNWGKRDEVLKVVNEYLDKYNPRVCIVNDLSVLCAVSGRDHSLFLGRGSVYYYRGTTFIPVDDLRNVYGVKYGGWQFSNDLEKIHRWFTRNQRKEVKFNYTVCRSRSDLQAAWSFLSKCSFISIDSETKNRFITCIGYTGLKADGSLHTYVIPFFNPRKFGGCHWDSPDEELFAWSIVRLIHASKIPKILQNGTYDSCYFVLNRVPLNEYLLDTMHMWHSLFCELPKKINYIASILLDFYRYWKDENKGDKEDNIGKTDEHLERYWRYNALDCHYTLQCAMRLISLLLAVKNKEGVQWALRNYCKEEFPLQVGPAFFASMSGMKIDLRRQRGRTRINADKSAARLASLRNIVGNPEFNPNSADQFAQLIYNVLGAKPFVRKSRGRNATNSTAENRSVDEKMLKHVKDQHPFFDYIINLVWECKKPRNNMSKYGSPHRDAKGNWRGLFNLNGRYMYSYNAAGTETGRFNGKGHQLWLGNNPQNWPEAEREIIVADPGYVFAEFDYAQSDAWFIAYTSEDPDYIATMSSGLDTHAIHAEHFFKIAYSKIVDGNKNKEEWCVHPTRGIRNITKRIVHGSNFRMAAFTLYVLMGKDSTIAAGLALGYKDAGSWGQDQCIKLCETLLASFLRKYKKLPEWFMTSVNEVVKNGNLAVNAFGRHRLFFGDLKSDQAIQRELSANYGQSGTAGNINRTMLEFHYKSKLSEQGVELRLQTHDSLGFMIPKDILHPAAEKILTIMRQPCTIKGRSFSVPADAQVGLTWGKKGMLSYHPGITYEQLVANDRKQFDEKYANVT